MMMSISPRFLDTSHTHTHSHYPLNIFMCDVWNIDSNNTHINGSTLITINFHFENQNT